jgi:hypothetical protein
MLARCATDAVDVSRPGIFGWAIRIFGRAFPKRVQCTTTFTTTTTSFLSLLCLEAFSDPEGLRRLYYLNRLVLKYKASLGREWAKFLTIEFQPPYVLGPSPATLNMYPSKSNKGTGV